VHGGRLQEKGVGNDALWLSILRRPLFARAADDASASLAHLTDIFVERQWLLWKVQNLPLKVLGCSTVSRLTSLIGRQLECKG
jgi:hypothetical protein